MLVSSAERTSEDSLETFEISLMYNMNNNGPSIEHLGTLHFIVRGSGPFPLKHAACELISVF